MKKHIDVYIASRRESAGDALTDIWAFARDVDGWEYLEEQSETYAAYAGEFSCAILRQNNPHIPAVAVTTKSERTFYVANIVPKECGNMTVEEYNEVARDFARDLRWYARDRKLPISVRATRDEVSLRDIISGSRSRELFERYLSLHPTSYHPLDVGRLDEFICCFSRYSKKNLDSELLELWLREKKGWSERDAAWCVNRIRIGLSVLKVNRRFYLPNKGVEKDAHKARASHA